MPKTAADGARAPAVTQTELEFARELRRPEDAAGEPTAEQLVALLSRLTSRTRKPTAEPTPLAPYKARPISFEASRWEIFVMWAQKHRRKLGLTGALLVLALVTAYFLRLVSLNAEIERQWLELEQVLRVRYALAPAYVNCLGKFADDERFTLTMTQRGLTAWRTARTEEQIVKAAAEMEQALSLLSQAMKRQEQAVPAMDPDQLASSLEFTRLERERERSRIAAQALVARYNAMVADYDNRVLGAPGSWLAALAHFETHTPIFGGNRG